MGLLDRITRTTKETQGVQSVFISLRNIYVFLHNKYPDATDLDIFHSFCLECNSLDKPLTFYEMVSGRPLPVNSNMITAFQSRMGSFEELGRNLLLDLSSVVRAIEHDPMEHPDAETYGFMREEISSALGVDFPAEPVQLRNYEAEIQELQKQLQVAQARIDELEAEQNQITKRKNPINEERFAKNREDVLGALIAIICHPEYYIGPDESLKLKEFGLGHQQLLQLVNRALPTQEKWIKVMDERGLLLWAETGEAPLRRSSCERILSEAINRLS